MFFGAPDLINDLGCCLSKLGTCPKGPVDAVYKLICKSFH